MRRAKIVCTLGPASDDTKTIRRLIDAGMNVCRLNFSHGTHEDHRKVVAAVRRESKRAGATVSILQDLQGPRIRTGPMDAGEVELKDGAELTITTRKVPGSASCVSTTFRRLPSEVSKGDRILLADGLIELRVTRVRGTDVECVVEHGGALGAHKGMNIPGHRLSISAMTPKDHDDLRFGVEIGVDWVALSFVRSGHDVRVLKQALKKLGAEIPVIAKLEKPQAIANLVEILEMSDGVMVARGDLAVETSPEEVPVLQKRVIREARRRGVPVITATQMLESMVEHPRPTRAEANDVANAIYDGTDAVMLSAETAVGHYPVETVELMGRIIESAESDMIDQPARDSRSGGLWGMSVSDAICSAAAGAAAGLGAGALAVFTQSGSTARRMAQQRPMSRTFAFSPDIDVLRRLALFWGIEPRLTPKIRTTDAMVDWVAKALRKEGIVKRGDRIVVTAGTPVGRSGSTNFLKVHRIRS